MCSSGVYDPFCIYIIKMFMRMVRFHVTFYVVASSAAQGGSGSFKNRKPIGEVGCCEPRMAERSH